MHEALAMMRGWVNFFQLQFEEITVKLLKITVIIKKFDLSVQKLGNITYVIVIIP